jgi:hypothetical protein
MNETRVMTEAEIFAMPGGSGLYNGGVKFVNWFAEAFPHGATPAQFFAECSNQWRKVWVACHWIPEAEVRPLAFRFAGMAFRLAAQFHPELSVYADNLNWENFKEAREAAWTASQKAQAAGDIQASDMAATAAAALVHAIGSYGIHGRDRVHAAANELSFVVYLWYLAGTNDLNDYFRVLDEQAAMCAEALSLEAGQ